MELFHRGGCLGRTGVFRGLCERDCVYQSFWNVAFGGYSACADGLVCVEVQKAPRLVLIINREKDWFDFWECLCAVSDMQCGHWDRLL